MLLKEKKRFDLQKLVVDEQSEGNYFILLLKKQQQLTLAK
jgi:hypothetical protein